MDRVKKRGGVDLKGWFTIGWLMIIGLGLILEGIAVKSERKGDTLSEHVWWVLGQADSHGLIGKVLRAVLSVGIVGVLVWLIPHFTLGWW